MESWRFFRRFANSLNRPKTLYLQLHTNLSALAGYSHTERRRAANSLNNLMYECTNTRIHEYTNTRIYECTNVLGTNITTTLWKDGERLATA